MRALILSDIHGNIDALAAIEAAVLGPGALFDHVWVLGDLVDYGPAPAGVIDWVRRHATRVVRGNHDHAMATGEDCRSAPAYHDLAVSTRNYFHNRLSPEDRGYLASLPLRWSLNVGGAREVALVHASPRDPLFGYLAADAPVAVWREALGPARSRAYVLVGHTHDQFTRAIDRTLVINPGSVGLPKDGDPRAAFAIFDDGEVELRRVEYDTGRAAGRLAALPLPAAHTRRLVHLIRHARLP
jgi:predicted phosphodiesterase